MRRRTIFQFGMFALLCSAFGGLAASARAADVDVDIEAVLDDPASPMGGNPKGDVTIVTFFDYNCPYCKNSWPDLAKLVRADGNIRVVYKDWPILSEASIYGARMALAAKYQGKYDKVHDALMAIPGRGISKEQMAEAIGKSGVDLNLLQGDLDAHGAEISSLLKRNGDQADSIGLQGTPVYLIGPFLVASALDYSGFKDAVAKTRAAKSD